MDAATNLSILFRAEQHEQAVDRCACHASSFAALQVPGRRGSSSTLVQSYRLLTMLSPGRFKERVLHRCPQPLQPLVEELHGLFFNQRTAGVAAYVMAVEPEDFLQVCRRQLARLKQM